MKHFIYVVVLIIATLQLRSQCPTTQPFNLNFSSVGTTSVTINWTPGNGTDVLVLARSVSSITVTPTSGTSYTAQSTVYGNGQYIGSNAYIVYNGATISALTVTNLNPGTTYYFSVFEYNTTGSPTPCYLTPGITNSITAMAIPIPTTCLRIKSVLVDACGSPEAYNEMVYFQNGSSPLPITQFSIAGAPKSGIYAINKWPNPTNVWNGAVQNATTAANVSDINASITNCGYVLEPPSGIIPEFANVILVGSQVMSPTANSFANLTDTVYMIFQRESTSTSGNFVNYGATSIGTRGMYLIDGANACTSNTITYEPQLLLNGSDGDGASYNENNTVSYYNSGCQAPFVPLSVDAGANQNICFNGAANLAATPSGVYNSVSWSGGTGTFSNPATLTTTYSPGGGDAGPVKIYCTITRACATSTTTAKDSLIINVIHLPQATLSASNGFSLCPSTSSTISYTVTNPTISDVVTPSWSSPAGSGTTYTVNSPNGTTPVNYTLNLSNLCGVTSVTFDVYPLAAPTISLSANSLTACVGNTLSLTATSNTDNYSWNNPVSTNSTVVLTANTTTTGIVTTTNVCGSDSDTYTLTVSETPTISVNNSNVNLCAGQSFTVIASSNVPTYTWQPGSINSNSIVVNSAGTHTVAVSNECGTASETVNVSVTSALTLSITSSAISICETGQTATLTLVGSSGSYSWSTGSSASTTTINAPGFYSATVTIPGCGSEVANISLGTAPMPSVTIQAPASTSVCEGSSIVLTAYSTDDNYLWPGGITTQTYSASSPSVVVTTTNACGTAEASQPLSIIPLPTVTLSTSATSLCPTQSATLQANPNTAVTYTWSSGDQTSTTTINTPGVITVTVTNSCGYAIDSLTIAGASPPVLNLVSSADTICPNETATLTVTGGNEPYAWSNSSNTGSVVTTNGGTVSVSNTNLCGTTTETITVSLDNLSAIITGNPLSGTAPLVVDFVNNSVGANSYLWSFGNGNTANTQTVTAQTYNDIGSYMVYLSVTNGSCFDIDSLVVTVLEEDPTLDIPNVFTPNGDSINDVFRIRATKIKEFSIIIFDRWGLKMYSSNDIKEGWDGKVDGKEASDGTYFYLINAVGIDDKEIKKQGTVTLFK